MSTEKKAPVGSSTKDLASTLGKKELMGIAIGQIIGAGIMSMMGVAIAMTGRSANLAFMLSAVFTMCTFFPSIFITSCIRMRGGMYTQMAIFAGDKWAGYYSVVYFITNMSLAMYALSFAQYALALLPTGGSQKVIALVVGTLFFILNYFGVDLMAKIQNLLVIVLLLSLAMFAVFGLPSVDFANYFSNADGLFLSDGISGFLTAVAYLGFATGGATVILGVSAECKNPTKDIPFVIVTSTIGVAILYGLVATTASGVLPVAEVANQPLTLVAAEILPKPLYIFFIVGGAMFALATTLNSQIMSCTKPVMQSCEDGWFPHSLAALSKYKTPWKILIIYYVILVVPIILELEIAQISSIVQILGYINNLVFTITAMKLPKMFPEAWEKSQFRVPTPVFNTLMIITCIAILIQASFMLKSMKLSLIVFNVAVMAAGFIWAFYRTGSGKAKPTVSYEMA
ncbi:MAG: APC family permease [Acutalibacteraceae bacterium]